MREIVDVWPSAPDLLAASAVGLVAYAAVVVVSLTLLALDFNSRVARLFALLMIIRALSGSGYILGLLAPGAAAADFWWRVTPYFVIPLPFVSLAFAAVYPRPIPRSRLAVGISLGAAALAVLLYFADHSSFWQPGSAGPLGPQVGAPAGPLFAAYGLFVLAFGVVAYRSAAYHARERRSVHRVPALLVSLGFAVVVTYDALSILLVAPAFVASRTPLLAFLLGGSLVVALALVGAGAVLLARRADVGDRRHVRAYFGSLVVAAGSAGLVVVAGDVALALTYMFSALWKLALPVLVAYALLNHSVFGLELKAKWTLERGTVAGFFLVTFLVVSQMAENVLDDTLGWVMGSVAAGLLLFAISPLQRLAHRIGDAALPGVEGTSEYFAYRKLVLYRAAVEGAWSDGRLTAGERGALDALRRELGIRDADAAAIEAEVEQAAPPAMTGQPG